MKFAILKNSGGHCNWLVVIHLFWEHRNFNNFMVPVILGQDVVRLEKGAPVQFLKFFIVPQNRICVP